MTHVVLNCISVGQPLSKVNIMEFPQENIKGNRNKTFKKEIIEENFTWS